MALNETALRSQASPTLSTVPRSAPGWLAALGAGAGLGALLASSCCLIPLGLAALGAGAGVFAGLEWLIAWRIPLFAASAIAIGGAWVVWWRNRSRSCQPASACAKPNRTRGTLFLLAAATIILAVAASWAEIEAMLLKS